MAFYFNFEKFKIKNYISRLIRESQFFLFVRQYSFCIAKENLPVSLKYPSTAKKFVKVFPKNADCILGNFYNIGYNCAICESNNLYFGLIRYEISDGKVTYQRRFVQTEVFKKNHAENKIVVTDFGTRATPDPCRSIFHRYVNVYYIN